MILGRKKRSMFSIVFCIRDFDTIKGKKVNLEDINHIDLNDQNTESIWFLFKNLSTNRPITAPLVKSVNVKFFSLPETSTTKHSSNINKNTISFEQITIKNINVEEFFKAEYKENSLLKYIFNPPLIWFRSIILSSRLVYMAVKVKEI